VPELERLRILWNRAADYGADGEAPEDALLGVVHLSYLLRRAVDAARYLGLVGLAELLEDLIVRYGDGAYAESRDPDLETILGQQASTSRPRSTRRLLIRRPTSASSDNAEEPGTGQEDCLSLRNIRGMSGRQFHTADRSRES
jgi:hypothetical protein